MEFTNNNKLPSYPGGRAYFECKTPVAQLKIQYPEGCFVFLKSGSPRLTVEWTREDGMISVVWFDGTTLCRDALHPDAIQF